MANSYSQGDAGNYPRKHNKRELKTIETAKSFTPTTSADWTTLPGAPTAPDDMDDALDILAAAAADVAKEVTGTLTSAQLLAMNATPQVVIAAPGAGKAIIVDEVELFLDYNSAAYAADAGEDLVLRCTTTTSTVFATWDDADTIIEGTADTRRLHKPAYAATFDPLTADNESIEFAILNGEWASGNSPIKYRIRYREVTLIV